MTSGRNKPADRGSTDTGPAYRALYEQLRTSILSGQLAAGARLPPTRSLAAETGWSRNTVVSAFDQLQAEGYIVSRRGSGTYVASTLPHRPQTPARADTSRSGSQASSSRLSLRGQEMARTRRVPLPAVLGRPTRTTAFLIGSPALDAFPYKTWSRVYASRFHRSAPQLMCYNDPAGYRPLREAIAGYIGATRGIHCAADQVLITTGSQQALEFCARILLDPGDPAWLEEPGYLGARAALVSAGARLVPVPVDGEGLDVAQGIQREPFARLAVVTPSHQFPLGHTMSLGRRLALIEWANGQDSWIVEDDYDAEFRYVGKSHAALTAIDALRRVIYVGTFSKVLFPGLRLGYVIAPSGLVDAFTAAHLGTDMHAHVIEQAVVADFLEQGHFAHHLRRMRSLYHERQHELIDRVRAAGLPLDVRPSNGGLHLVGHLPDHLDDRAIAQDALHRHGVHVWPMSTHYVGDATEQALLLGYAGTTPNDMRSGVAALADVIGRDG